MNTTALLIEILVSGTLATVWAFMVARLVAPSVLRNSLHTLSAAGDMGNIIAAVGILCIYFLGWMTHFLGESILDRFFQTSHRDDVFGRTGVSFYYVRTYVFEHASEASIADIQLDRQILRIARASATNLLLIAVLLPLQKDVDGWSALTISSVAFGIAGLTLAYWRQRYRSTFRKFLDLYSVLKESAAAPLNVLEVIVVSQSLNNKPLANAICSAVRLSTNVEVDTFRFASDRRNQLLLFLKPEVFAGKSYVQQAGIVDLILQHVAAAGVRLDGVQVLTGRWLRDSDVMDRHYGFINQLSRSASAILPGTDRQEILRRLEWLDAPRDVAFYGGHEFLARYTAFTAATLDAFWQSKKAMKLRSGLYVQRYDYAGESFVLVNGFHPQQLAHYTADEQRIVVALCHSDTDWARLRDDAIGDTFPERATPQSIRGTLWARRDELGLGDISVAFNYVHLSAGPIEGLYEIQNFLGSGLVPAFRINETVLGRAASAAGVAEGTLRRALGNPQTSVGRDLFSVTENVNTVDAVEVLKCEVT